MFYIVKIFCCLFTTTALLCNAVSLKPSVAPKAVQANKTYSVMFIGDSLVRRPSDFFGMLGIIQKLIRGNVQLSQIGIDGSTIQMIRETELPTVVQERPDAVILYWVKLHFKMIFFFNSF